MATFPQAQKHVGEIVKSRSVLQENKSGDLYFYCFNNLIKLKENAREKMKKF